MKKIIILAFCVLFFISSALAAESGDVKENHLSFATGVFSSKLEYGRDISRWELGVGVESGFPNLFIFSLSSDSDDVLQNLKDSFTLFTAFGAFASFDVIPSLHHDLDLGLNIEGLYLNFLDNNILGAFLNVRTRYAYNFSDMGRFFIEVNVPVAAYSRNLESGTGDFGLFLDEGVLAMAGLFGTKLGLSLGF